MSILLKRHPWLLTLWCIVAAFGTYSCMYGFRKPFTAAAFDTTVYGVALKSWLVSAQVFGYTLSKIIGVKVVSEMKPGRRVATILFLLVVAELALIGFALTPAPYNAAWLFVNGLPLGMVFGVVLGFLEGRRLSELFIACLCASFILADGFTKSIGATILANFRVSEWWMPAVTGALFFLPLLVFLQMLRLVPPPDRVDTELRSERMPMTSGERLSLVRRHGFLLGGIILAYMLITVVRSIRADFAPEIWKGLGVVANPALYTQSELCVGLVVTLLTASLAWLRDNRLALLTGLGICLVGLAVAGSGFALSQHGWLTPFAFMVLLGIGMYIPYVIIHTCIFERFVAFTREKANIGYLMSLADSAGYVGYCLLVIFKGNLKGKSDFLTFFNTTSGTLLLAAAGCLAVGLAAALRLRRA